VSTSDNTEFRLEFELLLRKDCELECIEIVAHCGELAALDVLLLPPPLSWCPNAGLDIFSTTEQEDCKGCNKQHFLLRGHMRYLLWR
jgi:hypothetical protein